MSDAGPAKSLEEPRVAVGNLFWRGATLKPPALGHVRPGWGGELGGGSRSPPGVHRRPRRDLGGGCGWQFHGVAPPMTEPAVSVVILLVVALLVIVCVEAPPWLGVGRRRGLGGMKLPAVSDGLYPFLR